MEMINRPRRLRTSANLRKMVRETRMDKSSLIYPMFIVEGTNIKEEIPSMMGQYRYSVDRMEEKLEQLSKAGIGGVMLFGIPDHKDELGSGAYAQDGIVQQGFRKAKVLDGSVPLEKVMAMENSMYYTIRKRRGIWR